MKSKTQKDSRNLAVSTQAKAEESDKELERLRQQVRRLEMLHKTQNEIIDDLRDELRARNADELSQMFMTYTDPPR